MIQQQLIIHFVTMILQMRIVIGIALHVKNVSIGENGIVNIVINVCVSNIVLIYQLYEFNLGTYGQSLPCERCGGKSQTSGFF